MTETFIYIPSGSRLARPEPSRDLIPMPVVSSVIPVVADEPEPVQDAILQALARIEGELRALRAQEATQNASAVTLEIAMAMLGCKRSQVFKLLERRQLERAPKVGRTVMITVASIEALLAEGVAPKASKRLRNHEQQLEPRTKRVLMRRRKPTLFVMRRRNDPRSRVTRPNCRV
jgi:hypothetical protein